MMGNERPLMQFMGETCCYYMVPVPLALSTSDTHPSHATRFCNCCWRQHFESQIGEGKARDLRCMAFKCGKMCSQDKVRPIFP